MTVYVENPRTTRNYPEGNQPVHSETHDYLPRQPTCAAKFFSKKEDKQKGLEHAKL